MAIEPRRYSLHKKLVELLGSDHVYFNPPETVKLIYPCIVYHRGTDKLVRADNYVYGGREKYELLIISREADYNLYNQILLTLPYSSIDRHYIASNLYHDAMTIYY